MPSKIVGAFWCKFWCILKMNNEDKIIAKLKEENEYLKSILRMHNISFEKPKEIKQFGFSDNEKIKTYISYFAGRDEVIRNVLHKKIDLVRFSNLNNNIELINEIMKDGIKIYR